MKRKTRFCVIIVSIILLLLCCVSAFADVDGNLVLLFEDDIAEIYGYSSAKDWISSETSRAHFASCLLFDYITTTVMENGPSDITPNTEDVVFIGMSKLDVSDTYFDTINVLFSCSENDGAILFIVIPELSSGHYFIYDSMSNVIFSGLYPDGYSIIDKQTLEKAIKEVAEILAIKGGYEK